ncbi:MAG: hypothetical protein II412_07700 [Clostridia bacterium]|nr:hypothetical protein [Clostridia bacterium]
METQWTPDAVLSQFGFAASKGEPTVFLHEEDEDGYFKHIIGVTTTDGRCLVLKFVHEFLDGELSELSAERAVREKQCAFASFLRENGILTPRFYRSDGHFCLETACSGVPCIATVEDDCGEEIREITEPLAFRIGALVAQIHTLSLAHGYRIGCGTLFSAAEQNDVDCMDRFLTLAKSDGIDPSLLAQIEAHIERKRAALTAEWDTLPKSAVQGDISINNLIDTPDGLLVFDYNNAGDVVLVSDLVLEGLLTAYEMDLPENVPASYRERLFPAFLNGYLSVRELTEGEQRIGWEIYTLYHALWFTRIVYNEDSLEKRLQRNDYDGANALLRRMLEDITEPDDGRFARKPA